MNIEKKYILKELIFCILKKRSFTEKEKKKKKDFRYFYALKKQVWKDNKKRFLIKKSEIIKKYIKSCAQNLILPENIRKQYSRLFMYYRNNSTIKNRCLLCGKAHSVYKKWRISRICFREQVRLNTLNGILKV